jgi:dipeptidyl aminopeptidase/acylaminoacyl peptidase
VKRSVFRKLTLDGIVRLTAGTTDHEHPAWSPDGRTLAFAAGPVDARRIYLVDRKGRFAYAIAPSGPHATRPRWAPDGRRLAFDARPHDAPPLVLIQELPEVGLEPRPLVQARSGAVSAAASKAEQRPGGFSSLEGVGPPHVGGASAIHAAFSPDGRIIAYASDEGSTGLFHLWLLDPETGSRRQVTDEPSANDAHPAFSPDGSVIAFHRYLGEQATQSSLFLLNVASGALLRLTDAKGFDKHACFATEEIILFHREHPDGTQDLRAVHVVEGHEISLTQRDDGDGRGSLDAKQPAVRITRRGGIRVAFAGRRRGSVAGSPHPYDLYSGELGGL